MNKTYIKQNCLFFILLAQPILDIIAYFQQDNVVGSIAGYSRLILMCIIPIVVLFTTRKKISFCILMSIVGIYSILHIFNSFRVGYINPFQDIAYLARVIQMPVLAISFMYLIDTEEYAKVTQRAFIVNLLFILVTVLIAHFTNTGETTYIYPPTGLTGWFANANGQSIIVVTLIPLCLQYVNKRKNTVATVLITLIAWFMLISNGTKVAYLSIILIFGGFIVYYIAAWFIHHKDGYHMKTITICAYIGLIAISILGYEYTPRAAVTNGYESARIEDEEAQQKELDRITTGNASTLDEIFKDEKLKAELIVYYTPLLQQNMVEKFGAEKILRAYGYLPDAWILSDVRMTKRLNASMIWEECDFLTKLFGFEYSNVIVHDGTLDLENDYAGIYYYYGYIGIGLYLLFIAIVLIRVFITLCFDFKNVFNSFNFALILTFLIQIGAAEFSGAILRRPNVSIYMSVIIALIVYQTKRRQKDERIHF